MQGFRIYSPQRFAEVFAPVFAHLADLTWLALPSSFRYPFEWLDDCADDDPVVVARIATFESLVRPVEERSWNGVHEFGYVVDAAFFPDQAGWVSSDWASLFGLRQPVTDARAWLQNYYAHARRDEYLAAHCSVVLQSVDSAFYKIFAESHLLDEYRPHLDRSCVRYEATHLANCPAL
ncbi:MAG: hypothetical protein JNN30_16105 [Rhodanobacteraceae bacterium]|nr:hypothetical protein [Rhodanobacteraceae bacterium]